MFSKTYTSNLVLPVNNFTNKYKNFSKLYINDNIFLDSSLYGIKRQHNFLSSNALLNNQSTFLNMKSANKLINFNFNNELNYNQSSINNVNNNFFSKISFITSSNNFFNLNYSSEKFYSNPSNNSFKTLLTYPNILTLLNDNSDKKPLN
jgi:hypothetical protein